MPREARVSHFFLLSFISLKNGTLKLCNVYLERERRHKNEIRAMRDEVLLYASWEQSILITKTKIRAPFCFDGANDSSDAFTAVSLKISSLSENRGAPLDEGI